MEGETADAAGCGAGAGRVDGGTALTATGAALAAGTDGVRGRAFAAVLGMGLTAAGRLVALAGLIDFAWTLVEAGAALASLAAGLDLAAAFGALTGAFARAFEVGLEAVLAVLTGDFTGALAEALTAAFFTGDLDLATTAVLPAFRDLAGALTAGLAADLTAGRAGAFALAFALALMGAFAALPAAAGLDLVEAFTGVLFFLAGDFTACLLWAWASG